MAMNLSPLSGNNTIPIAENSMTAMANYEPINSPSRVNNILNNANVSMMPATMNGTRQTLSGTLGGKYRIEGEVTLTPL